VRRDRADDSGGRARADSHADAILNSRLETSDEHFDNEVVDVSQLIHLLAGRTKVSEHKLIYMLAVSYFVSQYLRQRGGGRFETSLKMMENAFRTIGTSIAETYIDVFAGRADNPSILRGDCDAKQTSFSNFGFPPDLWVLFREFLLPILDYRLAAKWVASDLVGLPDVASYQTRCVFDGFQWPLLAGVCQIGKDATAIIGKKKKFDAYQPNLTGAWMNRILRKMKPDAKSAKIIDKLMAGKNHEPGKVDISDVYAWIDESFGGDHLADRKLAWRIPAQLPPLNKPP
jgi:hypothetical protein